MALRRLSQLQGVKSLFRSPQTDNLVAMIFKSCCKMQIRAMSAGSEDIPQFLHSVFTSPDLGSGATESKCKRFCCYYRKLDSQSRMAFLGHLAHHYSINHDTVIQGAHSLAASQERGEAYVVKSMERLRSAMTPRYQSLFQQIGRIEGGVKFLVDMRADLLGCIAGCPGELDTANFHALNRMLRELLTLWFAVGFLDLQRVTWTSPCDIVQKSIIHNPRFRASTPESEPQQQQQNLEPDSFEEDPSQITTAVFYSITSTQRGLQGVELGNYLIKSVVRQLQSEFPHLSQFSSLSPIPGFRDWLIRQINTQLHRADIGEEDSDQQLLTPSEIKSLEAFRQTHNSSVLETFKQLVQSNQWLTREEAIMVMKGILLRLCARYLYLEKRRGLAFNPVANFHLTNGAVLWRINFLADTSIRGLNQSCSLMVNYRYYLSDTENNSQNYLLHHHIPASPAVMELLGSEQSSAASQDSGQ